MLFIDIVTVYNDDGDSDDENGNVPSCVMTPPKVLLDCALHVGLIDVKNFDLDDNGVTIHHSDSDPRMTNSSLSSFEPKYKDTSEIFTFTASQSRLFT